jgi:hypothetical protein
MWMRDNFAGVRNESVTRRNAGRGVGLRKSRLHMQTCKASKDRAGKRRMLCKPRVSFSVRIGEMSDATCDVHLSYMSIFSSAGMSCAISTLRLPQIYMLSFGTPQVLRPMATSMVVPSKPGASRANNGCVPSIRKDRSSCLYHQILERYSLTNVANCGC